jgi:hypothetical protein
MFLPGIQEKLGSGSPINDPGLTILKINPMIVHFQQFIARNPASISCLFPAFISPAC